ncbi:MAG: NADH-quinone oxidoreductase subunit C [Candidatus Omnitrophica bacterium]|jgi:Ni,Fe-hydrogenase III component G|nr:NADH-quinone oxidoreductase subunit C [Candidatus Omnitrophota bacterium]
MNSEEKIQQELIAKFSYLDGKVKVQRARRIFAEVEQEKFFEVFDYIVRDAGFSHLCAITGLDEGPGTLGVIYHLSGNAGVIINLKTSIQKENPILQTVTPYFPGAEIYERELTDLLGVEIDTLSPGPRYPLPDDWPHDEFPLRKDWKPRDK